MKYKRNSSFSNMRLLVSGGGVNQPKNKTDDNETVNSLLNLSSLSSFVLPSRQGGGI